MEIDICPICRDKLYSQPVSGNYCPRNHCFHTVCINKWHYNHSQDNCPVCRTSIIAPKILVNKSPYNEFVHNNREQDIHNIFKNCKY
jgi:hypothetical protein